VQGHLQLATAGGCGFGSHGDGGGAIDGAIQPVWEEQTRAILTAAGQNADDLQGRVCLLCRTATGVCHQEQEVTLHPERVPSQAHAAISAPVLINSAWQGIADTAASNECAVHACKCFPYHSTPATGLGTVQWQTWLAVRGYVIESESTGVRFGLPLPTKARMPWSSLAPESFARSSEKSCSTTQGSAFACIG